MTAQPRENRKQTTQGTGGSKVNRASFLFRPGPATLDALTTLTGTTHTHTLAGA